MKILLTILFFMHSITLYAQQSPFENRGLLVVKVIIEASKKEIKILRPVLSYTDEDNNKVLKPFDLNPKTTNDYLKERLNYGVPSLHFDFANEYFIASIPLDKIKSAKIHLEDEEGDIIKEAQAIAPNQVFDLASNYKENWTEFKEGSSPKPLQPFEQLITISTDKVRIPKMLMFKEIQNKLNIKYNYSSKVIFENRADLEEVIELAQDISIDFDKQIVVFQRFRGDCFMQIDIFQFDDDQKTRIRAYDYYGGCRAAGRRAFLYVLDKPANPSDLKFEIVDTEDYNYFRRFWLR